MSLWAVGFSSQIGEFLYYLHKEKIEEEIEKIKKTYKINKVEIMSYHNLGESKWEHIGKEYKLLGTENVNKEKVLKWNQYINKLISKDY